MKYGSHTIGHAWETTTGDFGETDIVKRKKRKDKFLIATSLISEFEETINLIQSTLLLGGSTTFRTEDKRTVFYTFLLRGKTTFINLQKLIDRSN